LSCRSCRSCWPPCCGPRDGCERRLGPLPRGVAMPSQVLAQGFVEIPTVRCQLARRGFQHEQLDLEVRAGFELARWWWRSWGDSKFEADTQARKCDSDRAYLRKRRGCGVDSRREGIPCRSPRSRASGTGAASADFSIVDPRRKRQNVVRSQLWARPAVEPPPIFIRRTLRAGNGRGCTCEVHDAAEHVSDHDALGPLLARATETET